MPTYPESFVDDVRACVRMYRDRMEAALAAEDMARVQRIGDAWEAFREVCPLAKTVKAT